MNISFYEKQSKLHQTNYILAYVRGGYSLGGIPGILLSNWTTGGEIRRASLHILKDFGYGKDRLEEIIEEEVDNLIQHIEDNWIDTPMDVTQFFNIVVLASLWKLISGESLKIGDPELSSLLNNAQSIAKEFGNPLVHVSMNFLPLFKMLNALGVIKLMESTKAIFAYCKRGMDNQNDKGIDGENPLTFIEAFMHKINTTTDSSSPLHDKLGELNLLNTLLDFFIAGSDTTSNTLNWSMFYMIQNPDVQERVREELISNFGLKKVRMSERQTIPYTEAVLHEISRKGNIVPNGGFHFTSTSVKAGKFIIPKETVIIPLIGDIMHDSNHFSNPQKFDPERYLSIDSAGKQTFTPNPRVIPFGIGKRRCLGEVVARTSLFKFFTAIVQRYKIVNGQNEEIQETRSVGFVSAPKPYKLKFMKI